MLTGIIIGAVILLWLAMGYELLFAETIRPPPRLPVPPAAPPVTVPEEQILGRCDTCLLSQMVSVKGAHHCTSETCEGSVLPLTLV